MRALPGKRVLMLLENHEYASDARVRPEAQALLASGYDVTVICPRIPGASRFHEVIDGGVHLYTFVMPVTGSGLGGYVAEYLYALTVMFGLSLFALVRRGFDIIHTHNPPDIQFLIAGFYKLLGKRFVYDHHDLGPELYDARSGGRGNPLVRGALVMLEKFACRSADRLIATNESYKRVEVERGGARPEHITVVRNGPNLDRFSPVAPDAGLRGRAGTLLGYVGLMGPQDGVDYLLRAIRHLVYDLKREDVLCVIIGRAEDAQGLQHLARELQVERYVWFTGFIPFADLIRYLSTIDIGVDPDPSNPFNDRCTMIKMMSYMAMGKPTVAFDLPEHRVTARDAALYAQANNELEFARHIATLMDDPAQRERMGRSGRRRIETELAWPYQAAHLLEAYDCVRLGFACDGQLQAEASRP